MSEGIHQYFEEILRRFEGVLAIIVTDRDGVPVVKVADARAPSSALRSSYLAIFASATEQASKLGLSRNKNIICSFPSYQVVHFNYLPLVVSVIASSTANTGVILSLESDFENLINAMKNTVEGV
ncbi:ragulator complex protein LAMTOR3-A-like [Actinia tenebrosa]|uniref:Ragulator complex protein LAMTOR3-A-like n=1 Tax=Actinia tenebrosa TaxID=6105 RepID=A0A6P8ICH2_ACTTE|nr:ragulator complex protein LAMTOR3-A-like [Actinia tenebrosa]